MATILITTFQKENPLRCADFPPDKAIMKVEDLNQGIYYRGIATRPTVLFASVLVPVAIPAASFTGVYYQEFCKGYRLSCIFYGEMMAKKKMCFSVII